MPAHEYFLGCIEREAAFGVSVRVDDTRLSDREGE